MVISPSFLPCIVRWLLVPAFYHALLDHHRHKVNMVRNGDYLDYIDEKNCKLFAKLSENSIINSSLREERGIFVECSYDDFIVTNIVVL